MAANQEVGIATAERAVLVKIAEAKAQAINVLHAGRQAAAELKTKVATQVAVLHQQEAAAKRQLQAAGAQVGGQLAKRKRMQRSEARGIVRQARGALRDGVQQQTTALDGVAGPALAAVRAAPAGFSAAVGERRALMLTGIDGALTTAAGLLATSFDELLGSCIGFRMAAIATYVTAELQVLAGAQPEIEKARGQWKSKADEFVASCLSYETSALEKHGQARAGLGAQMTSVARKTVSHGRRSGWQKFKDGVSSGLGRIAGGLKWFVLGVIAVTIVIVVFVAGIPIGLALAIAAAIVGIVMLAVGFVLALYNRFKMLWNNDWPWWAKILGIPAAFGVALGDVLGLSQLAEAIRGKELISDKELSDEERWARATEGAFQVITLGLARWFTKKPASPKTPPVGELPPGDGPPALPPGDPPPVVDTPPVSDTPPASPETRPTAPETPGKDPPGKDPPGKDPPDVPPPEPVTPKHHIELALEIFKRNGNSVRKSLPELNKLGLDQVQMVEALVAMFEASGRRVGGTSTLEDGTVVLRSVQAGKNQPVNIIRPNGQAEFGRAEIFIDTSRGADPIGVRDVVTDAGEVLPPERTAPPSGPTPADVEAAGTRQKRIEELAKDPDNGDQPNDKTRYEAEVALTLEEQGRLPAPVRRPKKGDGHSGDFVDGAGKDWDHKRPRTRETLHKEIAEKAAKDGKPEPKLDPNKPMKGEYAEDVTVAEIKREIAAGEDVILDLSGLDPASAKALRARIDAEGIADHVMYFP